MGGRRQFGVTAILAVALLGLPACGGGGGGGAPPTLQVILNALEVLTQPAGPSSPFGSTVGGDRVRITGQNFATGTTATFNGVAAGIESIAPTAIVVVSPAGAEGAADVAVTVPGAGSATLTGVFQFIAPPVILSIAALTGPTSGENRAPIAGNETMEVRGQNLRAPLVVRVGTTNITATVVDPNTATFAVPSQSNEGALDIMVTTPEGMSSTLTRGLLYTQEFSLDRQNDSLTVERATHLYRRAGFGAPPDVINAAVAQGLTATINQLTTFTNDSAVEVEADEAYGRLVLPTNLGTRPNKEWWIHLLQHNPNPLQERLAFFLHDHFATSERDMASTFRWTLNRQVNSFRRFTLATTDTLNNGDAGLGWSWRQILIEMGRDRAMLDWLDGRVSQRGRPNENYARELWELFMLGEGVGYTEQDVQEAARAFTGFYWFNDRTDTTNAFLDIAYRLTRHDAEEKTIFGVTGFFGYDNIAPFLEGDPAATTDSRDTDGGIVALTLQERPQEASEFICRKLAQFFLYDAPHESVVDELATALRAPGPNQWNLKPIVEMILRSKAMYSSAAMKSQVKSPVDYTIGFLRSTGIDLGENVTQSASRVRILLGEIGQLPLEPPDVNGWPSGLLWMGAQSMLERVNFLRDAILTLDDVSADIDPLLPPAGQRSPAQLVDHLASILGVQLSGNARTQFINYVTSQLSGDTVVAFAFDPANDAHLRMKTRGLIWMIAQFYDGHLN